MLLSFTAVSTWLCCLTEVVVKSRCEVLRTMQLLKRRGFLLACESSCCESETSRHWDTTLPMIYSYSYHRHSSICISWRGASIIDSSKLGSLATAISAKTSNSPACFRPTSIGKLRLHQRQCHVSNTVSTRHWARLHCTHTCQSKHRALNMAMVLNLAQVSRQL
jgi:hypothetical protein